MKIDSVASSWTIGLCALLALGAGGSGCSDTATDTGTGIDDVALQSFDTAVGGKDGAGDAAKTDGSLTSDATTTCTIAGSAWCPCTANADCDSSICLDTPSGHVCAAKCVDSCPGDFTCSTVNSGGSDVAVICVPKWGWLCDPCEASSDCTSPGVGAQATCLDYGKAGRFCGFDCKADADCPSGYTCADSQTVDGSTRKQCRVSGGGTCGCSARATTMQLATTCAGDVGSGAAGCVGKRHCEAAGLTTCDAKPAKEACNGKDDDCDGQTDVGACDDQNGCTQDICDPTTGTCSHTKLDGTPCDADKTVCTDQDTCQAGVCIPGPPKPCTDGSPCTTDTCDATSGCVFTVNPAACNDGNACTDEACDKGTGGCVTTYNQVACDDGSACSQNDQCAGGVCKAGAGVDCADADACTIDSCDVNGGCKHTISTGVCNDGDACSYGETCASGVCAGGQNLACDDKNPCTADSCDKLTGCVHTAQNGGCDDGNACTDSDACAGGTCVGAASGPCPSDQNPCTNDVCDPSIGCISVNNSLPCSDGSVCTQVDACSQGVCVGGDPLNCADDGNPCTTESCNPVSGCQSVNNAASCDDGDACTLNDTCSGGVCKAGLPKDCSGLTNTCGTGECAGGACYQAPFPIKTVCPGGLCNGAGACEAQIAQTIDGCEKLPNVDYFQDCTSWGCYSCVEEGGFSAYNITDCAGTSCFDRFPTFGVKGMIVMWADWEQSAYVDWKFPKALIGNYKIEAVIPPGLPANASTCTPGASTYNTAAVYHLLTAGGELAQKTVDHNANKNKTVTLFNGDATGLTGIRLYNGPSANNKQPPACEFYLVDAVYATPL